MGLPAAALTQAASAYATADSTNGCCLRTGHGPSFAGPQQDIAAVANTAPAPDSGPAPM